MGGRYWTSWTIHHDIDGCEYAGLCTQGKREESSGIP